MGIKTYRRDEKVYWKVYVNLRSKKSSKIRKQKTVSEIESLAAARRIEKQVLAELAAELAIEINQGVSWEKVLELWEKDAFAGLLKKYDPSTIKDTVSGLKKWTVSWLKEAADNLSRASGKDILKFMVTSGLSSKGQQKIRSMVNTVWNYGVEERLIKSLPSPMSGIVFDNKSEKVPEVLNIVEIKKFLEAARDLDNPWYPIWSVALLTGMRNGELYALEWTDIDFENSMIRVSRSYDSRTDRYKSTKAGYWRNIPISPQLLKVLVDLRAALPLRELPEHRKFVLPHLNYWTKGLQAKELRLFLKSIGMRDVKFHALRACFATQLLSKGIPAAVVMKICGWKNLKTMEYYVRLAGVDEAGATDVLNLMPNEREVMNNVVSLF